MSLRGSDSKLNDQVAVFISAQRASWSLEKNVTKMETGSLSSISRIITVN